MINSKINSRNRLEPSSDETVEDHLRIKQEALSLIGSLVFISSQIHFKMLSCCDSELHLAAH